MGAGWQSRIKLDWRGFCRGEGDGTNAVYSVDRDDVSSALSGVRAADARDG